MHLVSADWERAQAEQAANIGLGLAPELQIGPLDGHPYFRRREGIGPQDQALDPAGCGLRRSDARPAKNDREDGAKTAGHVDLKRCLYK
jgi:hypothetical protein